MMVMVRICIKIYIAVVPLSVKPYFNEKMMYKICLQSKLDIKGMPCCSAIKIRPR